MVRRYDTSRPVPPEVADRIVELLRDGEQRRKMGEEGRRIALERFDERIVFEKVKVEYARLLQEKGLALPECGRQSQT